MGTGELGYGVALGELGSDGGWKGKRASGVGSWGWTLWVVGVMGKVGPFDRRGGSYSKVYVMRRLYG